MATTLHHAPMRARHRNGNRRRAGGVTNAIVDACLTVLMSLPVACRALVVLVALAVGVMFLYGKYWPSPVLEAHAHDPGQSRLEDPGAYTNGRPDPRHAGSDSSNPQNKEADHKAAEDAAAFEWHFNHQSEDNPAELAIGSDTDEHNYIHYRFFEKSDRCVFVKRRADGNDLTQWVRDPRHHKHDFDSRSTATHRGVARYVGTVARVDVPARQLRASAVSRVVAGDSRRRGRRVGQLRQSAPGRVRVLVGHADGQVQQPDVPPVPGRLRALPDLQPLRERMGCAHLLDDLPGRPAP